MLAMVSSSWRMNDSSEAGNAQYQPAPQAQQCGPGRHQRLARLLLRQPVQAAIEFTAVLVEERLEQGTGWLIDDILSERPWKGGHKRSISRAPPTRKYRSSRRSGVGQPDYVRSGIQINGRPWRSVRLRARIHVISNVYAQ
jgi:hypothetical protein